MIAPADTDTEAGDPRTKTLMRSGTAARLAGLSPSTLRIWEHRYGVVAPPKSASGQRAYSMNDVERLRLVKRLTVEGHAIGTIAHLEVAALVELFSISHAAAPDTLRVVLVGHAAARKLERRLRPAAAKVFDDLNHAEQDVARAGTADVLVIHLPTLHELMTERVVKLRDGLQVQQVIVVYSFGREAVAEALRATGATVRREPISGKELARLITLPRPKEATLKLGTQASQRHFSDTELVALTEVSSSIECECPRHLAEIVTLLVGFELYSTECASRNEDDAALHRHLHEVTSVARTMLEQALARLVMKEGLVC
jgi:DNA-binding transcriptional MerR regulator